MIEEIVPGDITSPNNRRDIIIGMNTDLEDVLGIGRTFVKNIVPMMAIELGSVLTFDFDKKRKLHMIICHALGKGGWRGADKYVRFGMDYLDHLNDSGRRYSIVQIGTGRVGRRDGADHALIRTAMTNSYLPVNLYIYEPAVEVVATAIQLKPMVMTAAWNPQHGPIPLQAAA